MRYVCWCSSFDFKEKDRLVVEGDMMTACIVIMCLSAFMAFYAMFGYPLTLIFLNKIKKTKPLKKSLNYEPVVSFMIVAHNEEKCIKTKLENILSFDYPLDKIQILVASDFCTDKTNEIVETFIADHPELNIILNQSKEHKGKTNAQNETQKLATGEILVMTDANSIFEKTALKELVQSFSEDDIWYVCGQLKYVNENNLTSTNESLYWKLDLKQREIESDFQTITAGNGSIYAVRNSCYIDVKPIYCHDSQFPLLFALKKKKSKYNKNAIAYEKAGETNKDEFKRKVRMNRKILEIFISMWRPMNVFKYKWFSLFYFGHRTCRYFLWVNHLIFLVASIVLTIMGYHVFGWILLGLQMLFVLLGIISIYHSIRFKPFRLIGYYSMTVISQFVAAFKQSIGKSKPTWEKAESTR